MSELHQVADNLEAMVPALLFLCAGVPLAALLDELGFFDALAGTIEQRFAEVPVVALWVLAALTTVVLNLDTTVVLLTPLYIRLARRAGVDPFPLALVPLLLAAFASSVLPVSNLTTLIAAERQALSVGAVARHLAPVSAVACIVGWLAYRRRHPTGLASRPAGPVDRHALALGSVVTSVLLAGFVVGPHWHIDPWMVALAVDAVLCLLLRTVPWREIPLRTAAGVAALAALVTVVAPGDLLGGMLRREHPVAVGGVVLVATAAANIVNNLPATLLALDGHTTITAAGWAWLAGVNTGSVLLPTGALANLLWRRIAAEEGVEVDLAGYVRAVWPIAVPALLAAAATAAVSATLG